MKVMKKLSSLLGGLLAVLAIVIVLPIAAMAAGKLTVTANSAYVREKASTSASIVGGVQKGESYDVLGSESDTKGYTWYKIKVDGKEGFVRGDLVTYDSTGSSGSSGSQGSTASTAQAPANEVNPISATVTGNVRVRTSPSTANSDNIVDQAKANTVVTVNGYDKDKSGNTWYYITYTTSAGTITGYIRSDFIKLSGELTAKTVEPEPTAEPTPVPTAEPTPVPTEEPVVYKDYEAVYDPDSDQWFLNNYTEGSHVEVSKLYAAKADLEKLQSEYDAALKKKKTQIAFLWIVIGVLVAAGVYAYIRFRAWYYAGDEETEEPVRSYSKPDNMAKEPEKKAPISGVQVQTVGASKNETSASTPSASFTKPSNAKPTSSPIPQGGVRLPDGRIQMPDGTIRRAVVGVKLSDGSIKLPDGRIRKPDGTIVSNAQTAVDSANSVRTGNSTVETKTVNYNNRTGSVTDDDDMEFGFLNQKGLGDE